jgi:hypothetical protein
MAINLGAPGDRRGPEGKMWLEYPEVGGPSTKVNLTIEPKETSIFRHHSTTVKTGDLKWIAGSGLEGIKSVTIPMKENGIHRVKLHFMEPEEIGSGKRVFDVSLQGKTVLPGLDLSGLTGGSRKGIVKEFTVEVKDQILRMDFSSRTEQPAVLSGVEWQRLP